MSLTRLFHLLIGIAVMAGLGWGAREYADPASAFWTRMQSADAPAVRITKRSVVYRIPADRALSFSFTHPVTQAKILLNPAVGEGARARESGFIYAIRASWIDRNGKILSSHDVFLQADAPDVLLASGDIMRFLDIDDEFVAEQDVLLFETPEPAVRFTVEYLSGDADIRGVDLRLFERRSDRNSQTPNSLLRLSADARELVMAPSALPADVLSDAERLEAVRNQWRAVGPEGVQDRDYRKLTLFEAERTGS